MSTPVEHGGVLGVEVLPTLGLRFTLLRTMGKNRPTSVSFIGAFIGDAGIGHLDSLHFDIVYLDMPRLGVGYMDIGHLVTKLMQYFGRFWSVIPPHCIGQHQCIAQRVVTPSPLSPGIYPLQPRSLISEAHRSLISEAPSPKERRK